jgi:7-carboxy-7-deazaguanine synthase
MDNLAVLNGQDQLKFVLSDRRDYEWAREFLERHPECEQVETVIFSPVFDRLEARSLAQWILEDGLPVRLGLQLHKFVWHPDMQGV